MATVNYSVPEEVKALFNATFAGRNKSAIIAELMLQAVEREERAARGVRAMDRLLARRGRRPLVTDEQLRAARRALRT